MGSLSNSLALWAARRRPGAATPPLPFLYLDVFEGAPADAAPLTTPRTALPGPGTLVAVESTGTLAVTAGGLEVVGSGSFATPKAVIYGAGYDPETPASGGFARSPGLALGMRAVEPQSNGHLQFLVTYEPSTNAGTAPYGQQPGASGDAHAVLLSGGQVQLWEKGGNNVATGLAHGGAEFAAALVLRAAGCHVCVRIGADWTLARTSTGGSNATCWGCIQRQSNGGAAAQLKQLAALDLGADLSAALDALGDGDPITGATAAALDGLVTAPAFDFSGLMLALDGDADYEPVAAGPLRLGLRLDGDGDYAMGNGPTHGLRTDGASDYTIAPL